MITVQPAIVWGVVVATVIIILSPPICQIDAFNSGFTHYFLLRLPPLDVGTFAWPLTLILMLCEWLAFALLAGVSYWTAGKLQHSSPSF